VPLGAGQLWAAGRCARLLINGAVRVPQNPFPPGRVSRSRASLARRPSSQHMPCMPQRDSASAVPRLPRPPRRIRVPPPPPRRRRGTAAAAAWCGAGFRAAAALAAAVTSPARLIPPSPILPGLAGQRNSAGRSPAGQTCPLGPQAHGLLAPPFAPGGKAGPVRRRRCRADVRADACF
jgi:hypothetical protein